MQYTDTQMPPHRSVMFEVADNGSIFFSSRDDNRGGNYYSMIAVANKLYTQDHRVTPQTLNFFHVFIPRDVEQIKAFRVYYDSDAGREYVKDHEEVPIPPAILAEFIAEREKSHPRKAEVS